MLRPSFPVAQTTRGDGVKVLVTAVDERPDQDFGRRGTGMLRGAPIHSDQDLADVFRSALSNGLSQLGFQPVTDGSRLDRSIKVEIREIEYNTSMGFFTAGVHTNTAIKAMARNGDRTLERLYRSKEEERVLFVPFAESNERMLNDTVDEVLTKLFADYELIGLLAEGTGE
jgi:uncharacterized lipoprotein YajG